MGSGDAVLAVVFAVRAQGLAQARPAGAQVPPVDRGEQFSRVKPRCGRQAEKLRQQRVAFDDVAVHVPDPARQLRRFQGDAPPLLLAGKRRPRDLAGARTVLQGEEARRRVRQRGKLGEQDGRGPWPRPDVEDADRAELLAGKEDWRAGVEAQEGRTGDERHPGKARVARCVLHDQHVALRQGVGAERGFGGRFAAFRADRGLEQLLPVVQQRQQCHRCIEEVRGKPGQAVKIRVAGRVHELEPAQHGQPRRVRQDAADGFRQPGFAEFNSGGHE